MVTSPFLYQGDPCERCFFFKENLGAISVPPHFSVMKTLHLLFESPLCSLVLRWQRKHLRVHACGRPSSIRGRGSRRLPPSRTKGLNDERFTTNDRNRGTSPAVPDDGRLRFRDSPRRPERGGEGVPPSPSGPGTPPSIFTPFVRPRRFTKRIIPTSLSISSKPPGTIFNRNSPRSPKLHRATSSPTSSSCRTTRSRRMS